MKRVAVTGMGIVSPLGNDPETFFAGLRAGRSGIRRLEAPFVERLSCRVAAPADFDGAAHFPPPRARMLDRVTQLALVAAGQAMAEAQLELDDAERMRVGVFLGTGNGGGQTTDDGYRLLYQENAPRLAPFSVLMAMAHAAASWIGIDHRLSGPGLTYSTACSSSTVAIGEAWRRIRTGEAPAMVAGGAEAPLHFGSLKAWEALKTLATEDPEDPSASCKPFARNRSGLVLGEGAGILVLEEWERATRRGTRIRGELVGFGLSTDPGHITRPTVEGQAQAMRLALQSAEWEADRIDYVNAHGTGTAANDAVETAAIKEVFGARAYRVPVSSTKSMHGHLLGAAGAVELIATLLALEAKTVPPTRNLRYPDPACDLDYVAEGARPLPELRTAMSNSFAFGGTNAVLLCQATGGSHGAL